MRTAPAATESENQCPKLRVIGANANERVFERGEENKYEFIEQVKNDI